MKKVPMTLVGAQALEKELNELKMIKRPQIIEAISEARAHGDLKENAEYHADKRNPKFYRRTHRRN
ncbi:GreA/GreB family elongation factor [Rickettsiella massiliensis]|uniref:transcription elongation factor GreA n=1 Tax=Rickettsiella massiliensis TaxID=676517 RepID=UPI000311EF70|nr:transcription elongation factor GreA [Rickettsiella massiliensis]